MSSLSDYFKSTFKNIISCDSEYRSRAGDLCDVVCFVYKDIKTNQVWDCRNREDILSLPFNIDETLFLVFNATAEFEAWLSWNIDLPQYVFDFYIENKNIQQRQTKAPIGFFSMLQVATRHQIDPKLIITEEEKKMWRDLILDNPNYTEEEFEGILRYCESDTTLTAALFEPTCAAIEKKFKKETKDTSHLATQIMVRGLAKGYEAVVFKNGIPCDDKLIAKYNEKWPTKKHHFVQTKNKELNVYDEKGIFRMDKFIEMLKDIGMYDVWSKSEKTNKPTTRSQEFDRFKNSHPKIQLLREVKRINESDRLSGYCVGTDGRSRGYLRLMATKTGRAAASSKDNPFMTPRWTRTFIKSPKDKILAYVDYKHQEPCIQAYLSGDRELIEAVKEDVYLHTARRIGALKGIEPNSNEEEEIRKKYKVGFLAVGYGQSPFSLAAGLGIKITEAKEIIHQIKTLYRDYYSWLHGVVDTFKWRGYMSTFYGWTLTCQSGDITNQRSLYNWPIQSHGSEMIRWALINLVQAGVEVNATIHDAVLVCLNKDNYDQEIDSVKSIMKRCSEDIVGTVINVDVEKIDGNWFQKKGAKKMFDDVMQELNNDK